MFEKGGEVFSIPRQKGEAESEETSEIKAGEENAGIENGGAIGETMEEAEYSFYENEKEYKSKDLPDNPDGFERGKGNLLVLQRLDARDLGKRTISLIKS